MRRLKLLCGLSGLPPPLGVVLLRLRRGSPTSLRQGYGGPPKLQRRRKRLGREGGCVERDLFKCSYKRRDFAARSQKLSWAPNLTILAARTSVGCSQDVPYRVLSDRIGLALRALKTSNMPTRRVRPKVKVLVRRRSSCVMRSSNCVLGGIRSITTLALHVGLAPHCPRLRPSDGLMTALLAT